MNVSQTVPKDAPVMKAWEAYKATEYFANTLKWAGEANIGQLWACFYAGYFACVVVASAEVAELRHDFAP